MRHMSMSCRTCGDRVEKKRVRATLLVGRAAQAPGRHHAGWGAPERCRSGQPGASHPALVVKRPLQACNRSWATTSCQGICRYGAASDVG